VKTLFVDAKVFLRYLTDDDREKADRVATVLSRAAKGDVKLVTTELVLAEVVWVLESSYGLKNREIVPLIRGILATPGIEVVNGDLVGRALDIYHTDNVDFVDGYIAAVMEARKIREILSFDRKHMARIRTITRREP